jgi:hypothetical protein
MRTQLPRTKVLQPLRILLTLGLVLQVLLPAAAITTYASNVNSAAFSGGAGTVSLGGTLYAKNGGALTLTVTTSSDTKCVEVMGMGAFTVRQTSSTAKSSWTFSFTAGTGDGAQFATASASPNFNANNCTGQSQTPQTASFMLDNTGPVVTAAVSPTPNGAGWNNLNVSITWSATDAGAGVGSGPTPATDSQQQNTAGVNKTASAADRLGNVGNGSVTVKLDKMNPTISGSRSPVANANGWNNTDVTVSFTCSDALSGIKSCDGSTTLSNSAANQSVTGTAVDNADKSTPATVSGINIDKVAPTLSGGPTTSPNATGWYKSDVTIHWTASDALSGVLSSPVDSPIISEGTGLTAAASVSDKAGNSTSATSTPAVKIDKTAPNTTATAPVNWNNTDVTVSLNASDALSGVASTFYTLDGAQQSGASVAISTEGDHTLAFWSVDNAGNTEIAKTVQVKIDRTPPTIDHTQAPLANANGWNNGNVTVTFTCADALSGIASTGCTSPQTIVAEGLNQAVTGTATDNAGNTATDPATVSIDKTRPTISALPDRNADNNGWYKADVTVTFACGDELSGIASCSAPRLLSEGANQTASGTAKDAADNSNDLSLLGISVDKTAPALTGAATTSPNSNGWYNADVTVRWAASDALSGLDGPSPLDSTMTGEGNNVSASASVSDLAGNITSATVSGIKIDRTPPTTLVGVPDPLASNWYAGDVLVTLSTAPDLSGVDVTYYNVDGGGAQVYAGPFNHTLKGIHTIVFWSLDKAGNLESNATPGHSIELKIDGVPPTINGSRAPAANTNGWNNSAVIVSFACSDAESGMASCSAPETVGTEGAAQSVAGLAQDNAGNTASATVDNISIDLTAPTLTGSRTPSPNASGWNNGDVTIHWTGQDGLSGIDLATQPSYSLITGEGINLSAGPVNISDLAGNVGSGLVSSINIDRTAPTISGSASGTLGANGWYTSPVTVHFTCADQGSGIAVCSGDVQLNDGANQSVSGTATDRAGNTANTTVSGINIDSTKPTITSMSLTNGAKYTLGDPAIPSGTPTCTASDSGSGVATCNVTVTGGKPNGVGQFTFTATATDKAGNQTTQPGAYTVIYRFDGFLQPINDTAHQTGLTTSVFKGGSTVPAKLQLMKVDGTIVQANTLPQWTTPVQGGATTATIDESVYSDPPTSGTTYRWDSSAQQYIYNWSTKGNANGNYYRVGVSLDDGQTYYVSIGLR